MTRLKHFGLAIGIGILCFYTVFCGHAIAGANPNAIAQLDLWSGNSTNDGVITGTATDAGTQIRVEVFTSPLDGPVLGADFHFKINQNLVKLTSFELAPGLIEISQTDTSVALGALPAAVSLNEHGYWGTATFETQKNVSGIQLQIGIQRCVVGDRFSRPDTLQSVTTLIINPGGSSETFNLQTDITQAQTLLAGESFTFQLFVPELSSQKTIGFSLVFENANGVFTDYFTIAQATNWLGGNLIITGGGTTLSALLVNQPIVPSSGHIATITLKSLKAIPKDFVLSFTPQHTRIGYEGTEWPLAVSQARITFALNIIRALAGDFDWDGDVDLADFQIFVTNFGATGPSPNAPYLPPGK